MANFSFSKSAGHNMRGHKPWERDENGSRDDLETLQFDFDDAPALTLLPAASQVPATASEVQHTSVAHEIARVALRHASSAPEIPQVAAAAGNTDAPDYGKPIELQGTSAPAAQHFNAGSGIVTPPSPQADVPVIVSPPMQGGAPTNSIDEDNLDDLLEQLNSDGVQWEPGTVLRVGFPQSLDDIPDHFRDEDGLDDAEDAAEKGLTFFSSSQQNDTMQALETWSDTANILFTPVDPGEEADIYVYAMIFEGAADASSTGIDSSHGSRIAFNTVGNAWPDLQPGTFGFHAMIHESGHSLGLTHPGDYDAGDDEPPTYEDDADYVEDTIMYSVMSYFDAEYTGYSGDGDGNMSWLATPRSHDMHVMHELYGANWDARSTNSTYGYNAFGVGELYDFTNFGGDDQQENPQLTIWDGGGVDWLDLSDDGSGVTLDLRPGAFSSTHGMTNNLSVAYVPDGAPDDLAGYIENARGGEGDDVITGNDRDNVLRGNGGDDILTGLDGDDELRGGDGDDRLEGGFGLDWFDGGAGADMVDFTYSAANWTVDLSGTLDDPYDVGIWGTANAGGDSETIVNVEDAVMGSGNDHVTGSSLANALHGSDGNDTLIGLAGDDDLFGGDGTDTLDGGDHDDGLRGDAGNDTINGGAGDDFLDGGTDDDTLNGGADDDTMHGRNGNDTINGGTGDDRIWGEAGNDVIDGGSDDDLIVGGDGHDTISGNGGVDDLDGGNGSDTVDYTFSTVSWNVSLTFETATPNIGSAESVRNFEGARMGIGNDYVRATAGANSLYGGAGQDELFGLAGNDWLDGEIGDDLLNGGAGDDFIFGGSGYDIASYADEFAGVLVDLSIAAVQNTIGSGNDLLQSIEGLTGSQHSDWLFGNDLGNQLSGGLGEDQMFGRDGADILIGGDGNDNLFGGLGNDVLSGGNGTDWANYSLEASGVNINLATENVQNTLGAGLDTLISIENVIGTASADLLIGNTGANRLEGGGGNDVITGGAGSDALFGGAGNDNLNGGTGNDVLEGGTGTDWALYHTGLASGITIDLYTDIQVNGGGGVDTLHDIENVWATSFANSLTGNDFSQRAAWRKRQRLDLG